MLRPDEWRPLMPAVRRVAAALAMQGQLLITQKDQTLNPADVIEGQVRGPIRLRLPR